MFLNLKLPALVFELENALYVSGISAHKPIFVKVGSFRNSSSECSRVEILEIVLDFRAG